MSGPLSVIEPTDGQTPVVVDVPHAGLEVPQGLTPPILLDLSAIRRDADLDVHRLFERAPEAGSTLVVFRLSRFVIDPNRAEHDIDALSVEGTPAIWPSAPRGLVWRVTTDGTLAIDRPLGRTELADRLERFYRPYRRAIREAIEERRRRFGFAVLVDGHSMPSIRRKGESDPGSRRADFVPGTRRGTTCDPRVSACVDEVLAGRRYTVAHDTPYPGGDIVRTFGRPEEGVHAIQIEVNRDLYLDEDTLSEKPDGFRAVSEALVDLVEALGRLDLRER